MQKFIVEGGVNLSGSITPSGNKNEALPVLAAALLANKPVIIHNVPEILDISIMKDLLTGIGVIIPISTIEIMIASNLYCIRLTI